MNQSSRILLLTSQESSLLRTIAAALEKSRQAAQIWTPASLPSLDERQAACARRLLLERRRARGWDEMRAAVALTSPVVRALIALMEGTFAALVLDGSVDRAPLDELLEARPGTQIKGVWMGRTADASAAFGWMDWPQDASETSIASALMGATESLGRLQDRPAVPVLVRFAGGNDPLAAKVERFHQTLAARCAGFDVPLYSPLFFDQGRLQATHLVAAIRAAVRLETHLPVLCIPQLRREEFSHRLRSEGGQWLGAWLAGAERPVVALDASCSEGEATATVERLAHSLHRQ